MQGTREVKYGSISATSNSNGTVFSSAETWGELKASEPAIGALAVGMGALVKLEGGSNLKLTNDSQKLPEGNFTIYFVMEKNNSGDGRN